MAHHLQTINARQTLPRAQAPAAAGDLLAAARSAIDAGTIAQEDWEATRLDLEVRQTLDDCCYGEGKTPLVARLRCALPVLRSYRADDGGARGAVGRNIVD